MSDYRIRKARAGDLPKVQEIARRVTDESFRAYLGDELVDWFIDSGESDRQLLMQLDNCDVLLKGNAIVAFAVYLEDLIHLLMVDVYLHRTGVGSRLLAHAENQLFARGNATIRVETCEGNRQAISFYRKNGWSTAGKLYDSEHGYTKVLFEKDAQQSRALESAVPDQCGNA